MTAVACTRCGSSDELARARQLRPQVTTCDRCWLALELRTTEQAPSPQARRCQECGRRPSRGHPLGGVHEPDGPRRWICFDCYTRRRRHVSADEILDAAAGLELSGDLEHPDAF